MLEPWTGVWQGCDRGNFRIKRSPTWRVWCLREWEGECPNFRRKKRHSGTSRGISKEFLCLLSPHPHLSPMFSPFFYSVGNGTCSYKLGKEVLSEGLTLRPSDDKQTGKASSCPGLDGFRMCAPCLSLTGSTYSLVSLPFSMLWVIIASFHDLGLWYWTLDVILYDAVRQLVPSTCPSFPCGLMVVLIF